MRRGDLDRFFEASALEQVEAADGLFRLRERAVRDHLLAVADTNGARPSRRSELVARQPDALGLEVVHPREALLFHSRLLAWLGLRLTVHPLAVPAHQQQ